MPTGSSQIKLLLSSPHPTKLIESNFNQEEQCKNQHKNKYSIHSFIHSYPKCHSILIFYEFPWRQPERPASKYSMQWQGPWWRYAQRASPCFMPVFVGICQSRARMLIPGWWKLPQEICALVNTEMGQMQTGRNFRGTQQGCLPKRSEEHGDGDTGQAGGRRTTKVRNLQSSTKPFLSDGDTEHRIKKTIYSNTTPSMWENPSSVHKSLWLVTLSRSLQESNIYTHRRVHIYVIFG